MLRILTAAAFTFLSANIAVSADAPKADSASSVSAAAPIGPKDAMPKPFSYIPKESDIVTGKENAPLTVVEYASLSCPHCSHFFVNELPQLNAKYIDTGKVKLVYRNYPLNDAALKGAELVECAEPDRRHAFVKVLFTTQAKWAYDPTYRDALGNIAVLGGIDRLKFEACMNDKTVEKKVLNVAKEASDDYKVDSTPTFFIGNTKFKGPHDAASIGKAIDDALAADKK